jgi:hypothetical protein
MPINPDLVLLSTVDRGLWTIKTVLMKRAVSFLLLLLPSLCFSQQNFPHLQAHAHNDYEHEHPLKDALRSGFNSVEADVHLFNNKLLAGHDSVTAASPSLEVLYLAPLDSILKANGGNIYAGHDAAPFYLMIDIKTEAEPSYQALRAVLKKYPSLLCKTDDACAVKIFLSGNRPVLTMLKESYNGMALDGRPGDVGKKYSPQRMPVISDSYKNWSAWNGVSAPGKDDLLKIRTLAQSVHAEGKKLRLWAIPDNALAWKALMDAGVDLINSDRLEALHEFLSKGE